MTSGIETGPSRRWCNIRRDPAIQELIVACRPCRREAREAAFGGHGHSAISHKIRRQRREQMNIGQQLITVMSVVAGGAISLAAAMTSERIKWRREHRARWADRQFEAYRQFAHAVGSSVALSRSLATSRGLMSGPFQIPLEDAESRLLEADYAISLAYESVRLLGGNEVVNTADMLRYRTWELCDLARGVTDVNSVEWDASYMRYRDTRSAYYAATRTSLSIPRIERDPPPSTQNPVSRVVTPPRFNEGSPEV